MSKPSITEVLQLALTAGGLYLGWRALKGIKDSYPRDQEGKAIAPAPAAIIAIGDIFGVPRTDNAKCEAALRDRRWFDASTSCSVKRLVTGK